MAFYHTYRPRTVEELDNTVVSKLIANYLSRKDIPHAFLFTGAKGTGKTSSARIIAKSVNCLTPQNGLACGKCEVCLSIAKGDHLDILEIDAASNRGIDEIRELREKIKLSPTQLKYKVYIIDEVHMLTNEAFNALLKTLEEPPKHAIFILATTESHKIPDTIISRCVRINFAKASKEEVLHALKRAAAGEGLSVSDEVLSRIADAADGSFRDAHKLLEEVGSGKKTVSDADVTLHLGSTDTQILKEYLELLRLKDVSKLLVLTQKLVAEGKNISQFFLRILQLLEQELIHLYTGGKSEWSKEALCTLIPVLSTAFSQMKFAPIPSLPFELAIVTYGDDGSALSAPSAEQSEKKIAPAVKVIKPNVSNALIHEDAASVLVIKEKWVAILDALKNYNHSIAGVLRSCRPLLLKNETLTIEASYKFHAERLNDVNAKDAFAKALKDVVGLDVQIEVVLKKE